MKAVFKPGLYAITPQRHPDLKRLVSDVRLALDGGAAMIQFRDKSRDQAWRAEAAGRLVELCKSFGTPMIVNDDPALAAQADASGVHVGREDVDVSDARRIVGPHRLLGVSCYNDLGRARRAADCGADYLAFGSMFESSSKPGALRCSPEILREASSLGLPVVAIGGITPENGRDVIAWGADSLAVIGAVFDAPDVHAAAASFSSIWHPVSRSNPRSNKS